MANVNVRVKMDDEAFTRAMYADENVVSSVAAKAEKIATRANGSAIEKSGVWHDVGQSHTPRKSGGKLHENNREIATDGGKTATYGIKSVERFGRYGIPVSVVYTSNYAAAKDNLKHNTLTRAIG